MCSEKIGSASDAVEVAKRIGYPVMMKAAAGGGGRGMKVVHDPGKLPDVFAAASAEAGSAFGDPAFPPPQVSVYDCRRHPWVQLPPGVTRYDKDPD